MSTTTETTKRAIQRFYIDEGGELYRSYQGQTAYLTIPVDNQKRLAQEAVAIYMSRGFSRSEILSGEALPDRIPPASSRPKVVLSDAEKAMRKAQRKAATAEKKALVKRLMQLAPEQLAALVPEGAAAPAHGNGAAVAAAE